ncbi:MAG: hypothetical protein ABH871_06985 [Pseudomonadota bacterium]
MVLKIGGSEVVLKTRTKIGGHDVEALVESTDASGKKQLTYYIREDDGTEVTLRGKNEAIVQRPDGTIRYFSSTDGVKFEFKQMHSLSPTDKPKNAEDQDKALIESALVLFHNAMESPEGFKEVEIEESELV